MAMMISLDTKAVDFAGFYAGILLCLVKECRPRNILTMTFAPLSLVPLVSPFNKCAAICFNYRRKSMENKNKKAWKIMSISTTVLLCSKAKKQLSVRNHVHFLQEYA